MVGDKLKLLEEQGLADDTIIFTTVTMALECQEVKGGPIFPGINVPLIVHILRNGNIWPLPTTKSVENPTAGLGLLTLPPPC